WRRLTQTSSAFAVHYHANTCAHLQSLWAVAMTPGWQKANHGSLLASWEQPILMRVRSDTSTLRQAPATGRRDGAGTNSLLPHWTSPNRYGTQVELNFFVSPDRPAAALRHRGVPCYNCRAFPDGITPCKPANV